MAKLTLAEVQFSQVDVLTLPDLRDAIDAVVVPLWPDRREAILGLLARLETADGGKHWRHTLGDLAIMNGLIAGPGHPDWPKISRPLQRRPDLISWIVQHKDQVSPDLLRLFVLLHDLGKSINSVGHEELSYRMLGQAVGRDWQPGSAEALVALLVRHHALIGSLVIGMISPVALLPFIVDIRRYGVDLEQILTALILMTMTEFAVYDVLSPVGTQEFLIQAGQLRQAFWWTQAYPEVKGRLWQEAIGQTPRRLSNLMAFVFDGEVEDPAKVARLGQMIETMALRLYPDWADFQRRLALLWVESGYSLFADLAQRLPDLESRISLGLELLKRWLPSPAQVAAFENGQTPLYLINLRPIVLAGDLDKRPFAQLEAELARLEPISVDDLQAAYQNL
jgi:hypothetical protein